MMTTTIRPATQKQFDLLKRLIAERELDADLTMEVAMSRDLARRGALSTYGASRLIDALFAAPRKVAAEPVVDIQAGVYADDEGQLYRVYLGQNSGTMLVKAIETYSNGPLPEDQYVTYTYLGSAARHLPTSVSRLPLEEVGKLGVASNHCLMCGRRLDDPESVDRGIGPVCAANYA